MPRIQRARAFKQPGRLYWLVFLSFLSWCALGFALWALAQMLITSDRSFGFYMLCGVGGYIFLRVWGYVQALNLKCPLCHGMVMHQAKCHKHRDARRLGPLNYRTTIAIDILTTGKFICMYCGTPFRMKK